MKKLLILALFLCGAEVARAQYLSCFLPSSVPGSTCVSAASVVGTVHQTGLTGSMSLQTLCTTTTCPGGLYQVHGYVLVSTAAVLGAAQATINYTDDIGATSQAIGPAISLAGVTRVPFDATVELSGASGITVGVTVSGLTGTPSYSVYLAAVELLGF